jgi:hypothetical protein
MKGQQSMTQRDPADQDRDGFPRIELRLPKLTPAEAWMVYEVAQAFVNAFWRLYQDDIIDQLLANGALPGFPRRPEPIPTRPASGCDRLLLRHLAQMEDPHIPLVFIPDLIARSGLSIDLAHRALADLCAQGALELRPDSGVGLLKPDEAEMCPKALDGTPLTYARRIRPGPARR